MPKREELWRRMSVWNEVWSSGGGSILNSRRRNVWCSDCIDLQPWNIYLKGRKSRVWHSILLFSHLLSEWFHSAVRGHLGQACQHSWLKEGTKGHTEWVWGSTEHLVETQMFQSEALLGLDSESTIFECYLPFWVSYNVARGSILWPKFKVSWGHYRMREISTSPPNGKTKYPCFSLTKTYG